MNWGGLDGNTEGTVSQNEGLVRGAGYPESERTSRIIAAAMDVHDALGPGLLESAYEACLDWELRARGMSVMRQVPVPVRYKGVDIGCGYRLDLLVDDTVVLELKTVVALAPVHTAQVMTYLRLSKKRVGLLINFYTKHLRTGIKRVVL
jgi:GxxExxY protein